MLTCRPAFSSLNIHRTMTINEFWKELNEREDLGRLRILFEHYTWVFHEKNKRFMNVGIDLFQWLLQHSTVGQTISRLPSDKDGICTIVSGIASKVRYLQSLPINFVMVIDGTIKNEKLRSVNALGSDDNQIFEHQYNDIQNQIEKKTYTMNGPLISKVVQYFGAANIDYIFATGDAEIELARLNHLGVIDGIISNDADSLAYGANLVFRNFSRNKLDNPQTGKGKDQTSNIYVTPISLELLKKHGLGTDEIMFLALCQGDDYTNGMKSLGIKKAWNLASKKMPSFDVVRELKRIYSYPRNGNKANAVFAYSYEERTKALAEYEKRLNSLLRSDAQALFGHRHNLEVTVPNDYIIASHLSPYYTKHIFAESQFSGNQNNYKRYNQPLLQMDKFEWNRYGVMGNFPFEIRRENDLYPGIGRTLVVEDKQSRDHAIIRKVDPLDWFSKIKYPQLLDASRTTRNKLTGYDYLVDELGKCFVWKAILCMNELELGPDEIYIKSKKQEVFELDGKKYNFTKYQVMVKKRQIFKRYVQLNFFDDDLNPIEEKPDFVWMPDFMFKEHPCAQKLLKSYNVKMDTPKKKTPKKSKYPTQTTNLDVLSKSPKSPFRMVIKQTESLDLLCATTMSLKHPSEENPLVSPRKKLKCENVEDIKEIKVGDHSFSYEFDAETSRVLGTETMDGIPDQFNPTTVKDLLAELNDIAESNTGTDQFSLLKCPAGLTHANATNVKTMYGKLGVNGGLGDLDLIARLPEVPTVSEYDSNYLKNCIQEKDTGFSNNDDINEINLKNSTALSFNSADASFTDTDGAIEQYLKKIDNKAENKPLNVPKIDESILSKDSLSDCTDLVELESTLESIPKAESNYLTLKEPTSKQDNSNVFMEKQNNNGIWQNHYYSENTANKLNGQLQTYMIHDNSHPANSKIAAAQEPFNGGNNFTNQPNIIRQNHLVIDLTLDSDDEKPHWGSPKKDWSFQSEDGMILAEDTEDEELFTKT